MMLSDAVAHSTAFPLRVKAMGKGQWRDFQEGAGRKLITWKGLHWVSSLWVHLSGYLYLGDSAKASCLVPGMRRDLNKRRTRRRRCSHPVGNKDSLLPCKPVVTCPGHQTILPISFSNPQFRSFLANTFRFNSLAEGGIQGIRKRTGK